MPLLPFGSKPFKLKSAPGGPTATGRAGDVAYDSSYVYICVATNTWERAAIDTWTPPSGGPGSPMGLLLSLTYSA